MKIFLCIVASVFVLTACAATNRHEAQLNETLTYTLPEVPWKGDDINAHQQVSLSFADKEIQLTAALRLRQGEVRVIFLDMTGQRVLDLIWTQQNLLVERAAWLPEQVSATDVLARIVLAYWPAREVEPGLTDNMALIQKPLSRFYTYSDQPFIKIQYSEEDIWNSRTVIDQPGSAFRLVISSQLKGVN
ncbi:DUF3261 domain-containing protein [Sneathiella glossodoripedis]|uniref:DUF3261 domain-containing protein n=1 Tax=Sneathiella glossodoripedis TaxID=418853 RepID=UPI00046EF6B2|nr:DUF3261 domain-containing protein [Sneathiella glossodoripedis]